MTALCPVCALERWRRIIPTLDFSSEEYVNYVFLDPDTGLPILRSRFNDLIRDAHMYLGMYRVMRISRYEIHVLPTLSSH